MHASKFYSGSVAFNNKFLDMWRYEGSPDYLTLDSMIGYPGSPDAKMMSSGLTAGFSTGTEAIVSSTDKALSRCYSVMSEDRRLDLEADSEATRDLWTSALVFLMREYRTRSVMKT
ncbi:hypothetical protein KRP22_001355 [Phytophthora ramorum]|nr:hypothetical protein KRP22_7236 [Phytophthora ramorum]